MLHPADWRARDHRQPDQPVTTPAVRPSGEVARLRADPELIPGAVEELLRCSRLGGLAPARVTREDVAIGGVVIPAGEQVIPLFGTANRDPSVFADPDRFDVTRDAADHLSFGAGVHHCLGAQLARVELQEAFRGLIGRLPGLRLAVPADDLEFKPGMAIHSLRELPVLWDQPARSGLFRLSACSWDIRPPILQFFGCLLQTQLFQRPALAGAYMTQDRRHEFIQRCRRPLDDRGLRLVICHSVSLPRKRWFPRAPPCVPARTWPGRVTHRPAAAAGSGGRGWPVTPMPGRSAGNTPNLYYGLGQRRTHPPG